MFVYCNPVKSIDMKRFLHVIMPFLLASFTLSGCYTNILGEENNVNTDYMVVSDPERVTGCDYMLLAPNERNFDMITLYPDGSIEEILVLHGDELEEVAIISFHENGLVESLSAGNMTLAFSNYEDNKVDVAMLYEEEMSLVQGFEVPDNWDQFVKTSPDVETRGLNFNEDQIEGLHYVADQFDNLFQFISDADVSDMTSGRKAAFAWLGRIVLDSCELLYNLHADDTGDVSETVNQGLFVVELAQVVLTNSGPWGYFFTLLGNYETYVSMVEDLVYSALETIDDLRAKKDLGISSLNSGFGALKVTLSWSFYADIDLHAIEPSGAHIYWSDQYSDTGYLDVDNTKGGGGSVENIFWKDPQDGTYRFYIDYYGPSSYNYMAQSGVCRVAVLYKGQSIGVHNIPMTEDATKDVQTITIKDGMYSIDAMNTRSDIPDMNFEFVINRNQKKNY